MQETIQTQVPRPAQGSRLQFIDFTRGLVMILMAWDHVSNFWMEIHGGLEGIIPYSNPLLDLTHFLARFVTHWCAPTFVFLSGVSLAFSVRNRLRRGQSELDITLHIIKRGLVLLILESLIVSPAFDLPYLYFGVIAAIGVSLILFSFIRKVPPIFIFIISLIIILNHQWLDLGFLSMDVAWSHYLRRILHEPGFSWPPYFALYPVIPWIGVMGLGWVIGDYLNRTEPERLPSLKVPLATVGVSSIVMFFVVRWLNGYGNLVYRWSNDIIDWLYISKYPPSISYLLWTLGGMCIFMTIGVILQERNWSKKNLSGAIHTFGRTPLFFYLTHLWFYRLRLPKTPAPFHLNLAQTLGLWMIGLIVLWQMCLHYEKIKRRYPRFLQYI